MALMKFNQLMMGQVRNISRIAACNLWDYFREIMNTAGTAGIYACGDNASTLRSRAEQALSAKQEAPSFRWG